MPKIHFESVIDPNMELDITTTPIIPRKKWIGSNFWEEKLMKLDVLQEHEEMIGKFTLPSWMPKECPNCNSALPSTGIRQIGLCFNTRNFGDIVVEFMCNECGILDYIYFRKGIANIDEYISALKSTDGEFADWMTKDQMMESGYNNVVEKHQAKL